MQLRIRFSLYILLSVILLFSCKKDEESTIKKEDLTLIKKIKIDIKEPSGLDFNPEKNLLYIVSDNTNKIYKLNTSGDILQTYNYEGNDLEGVCFINNNTLLIAEERKKQLVEYNIYNNSKQIYQMYYSSNEENNGIEGICYDQSSKYYFLNEKNPGKLFILDDNFNIISSYSLNFANDYSGIFFDKSQNCLWICSDESQLIAKCNLKGEVIKKYNININKCEGICIDTNNKIVYLVSDSENTLYKYKLN